MREKCAKRTTEERGHKGAMRGMTKVIAWP
jgi:hypothetical protein